MKQNNENKTNRKQLITNRRFIQLCKHAYKNGLVDEYTHTALKSISMGYKVEMVVGKRYSPNGLRVLAQVKEIAPQLLTIHADSIKTYNTAVQIGSNILYGNKGDPYTYDVGFVVENCTDAFLEDFKGRFDAEQNSSKELTTKQEVLSFADLIEKIQNEEKPHKSKSTELER